MFRTATYVRALTSSIHCRAKKPNAKPDGAALRRMRPRDCEAAGRGSITTRAETRIMSPSGHFETLRHVVGAAGPPPKRTCPRTFYVGAAIDDRLDVVAGPGIARTKRPAAAQARIAPAAEPIEHPEPHAGRHRGVVGPADPFGKGAGHRASPHLIARCRVPFNLQDTRAPAECRHRPLAARTYGAGRESRAAHR